MAKVNSIVYSGVMKKVDFDKRIQIFHQRAFFDYLSMNRDPSEDKNGCIYLKMSTMFSVRKFQQREKRS
jgi:hypothetical protein